VQRPARGLDLALVTPVDLCLGASQDLKAPVQVGRIGRDEPPRVQWRLGSVARVVVGV
jgi:hypothetical protein